MRVVICPNTFRDCLGAADVADAMRAGVERALPGAVIDSLPLADGGDGSADALVRYLAAASVEVDAPDARGAIRKARFLRWGGGFAFVETAETCGLSPLGGSPLAPLESSTFGVGVLIDAALRSGAHTIFVGAGGSATLDAGAGALVALGAELRDDRGRPLAPSPLALREVASVDASAVMRRLAGARLVVLSDVRVPLDGNFAAFGRQKGLTPECAPLVAEVLARLDRLARVRDRSLLGTPWLGAGGGLAAGLSAFAGASVEAGSEWFLDLVGFDRRAAGASIVLTGEGTLDASTAEGKLPFAVATRASRLGVRTAVIAGRVAAGSDRFPPGTSSFELSHDPARSDHGDARRRIAEGARVVVERMTVREGDPT